MSHSCSVHGNNSNNALTFAEKTNGAHIEQYATSGYQDSELRTAVFFDVTFCDLVDGYYVSEVPIASAFRIYSSKILVNIYEEVTSQVISV
jgi:hypothetical protein